MKEKRAALIKKCRDLLDKIKTEERTLTDDEKASYDGWKSEADSLTEQIKMDDALREEERELEKLEPNDYRTKVEDGTITGGEDRSEKQEWRDKGEFFRAIGLFGQSRGMEVDPRLRGEERATGMSENLLSDGGFLVPPEYATELLHDALQTGVLAAKCRQMPMGTNSLTVPGVDESSRASTRWGGVLGYWENEADTITASKPKFRNINLKAKKLTGLCYVTDELLEDANGVALSSWLNQGFADEFGFRIDDAIINGSGAGQPLGIMNNGSMVSVSKETGQAAATIVGKNIMKMLPRLLPRSMTNAIWLINQDTWEQIFQLAMQVGTAGVPLYMEPGKIKDAPYGSLFGRPIQPVEQCQTLGTTGDIILADLSQYLLCTKAGGMQTATSMHVQFTTAEMAYRFILRIDGQPIRSAALTPYKGSATQSNFIKLNTRS